MGDAASAVSFIFLRPCSDNSLLIMSNHGEPVIYNFEGFMYVLDVGLKTDYFEALASNDFNSVLTGIEFNY